MEYHWVLSTAVSCGESDCFGRERVESIVPFLPLSVPLNLTCHVDLCSKSRSVPESLPNVSLAFSRRHLGSFSSWLPPGAGVLPALGSAPASTHAPPHSLILLKKKVLSVCFYLVFSNLSPFLPCLPRSFSVCFRAAPLLIGRRFALGGKDRCVVLL